MKLVVGCPVYERAWVLNAWFDHVADFLSGVDPHFVFIYTPSGDGTKQILTQRGSEIGASVELVEFREGNHSTQRNWGNPTRIETMAALRNKLLETVRRYDPDAFFSLDSDILPPKDGLMTLIQGLAEYDAVAPLAYLAATGTQITNAMYLDRHVRRRVKAYGALQPARILCAAKLMGRRIVMDEDVTYGFHTKGEDLYWSAQATTRGYQLGIDTSVKCKHVMHPDMLDVLDERIGW